MKRHIARVLSPIVMAGMLMLGAAACSKDSANSEAGGTASETVLQVHGLRCGCGDQIREALANVDGVLGVDGDFIAGRVVIKHDAARASVQALTGALDKAGFPSEPYKE